MRSYSAHLKTTFHNPDAVHRASSIFPIFHSPGVRTRVLFLGYWQLKRKIADLSVTAILRNLEGIKIQSFKIDVSIPKAYEIDLAPFIKSPQFFGTIEIEILSSENLVFPFPAMTVNYYGPSFSSAVHTTERVYNDLEDAKKNSATHVPESGFNLRYDKEWEPFVTFINGPQTTKAQDVKLKFYNQFNESLETTITLRQLQPYELTLLYLKEYADLKSFLKGKTGTCKLDFLLEGVFPRLLVGNLSKSLQAQVVTHTYYDCSAATKESDYWPEYQEDWYQESLMIPLLGNTHTTSIDLYPIFSPSHFFLNLEIFNASGKLIKTIPHFYEIKAPFEKFQTLFLDQYVTDEKPYGARISAEAIDKMPARIKIAFNIGLKNKGIPCNICTNLQPFVPAFQNKKSSFKWAPFIADQPKPSLFLMNSCPKKVWEESAQVGINFYRKQDGECLKRNAEIPPQGLLHILLDDELKLFFGSSPGWVTVISSNPYLTLYYLNENPSGIIGGDHGY